MMADVMLSPFVQDVIATGVAVLAFAVLVYRTGRIFRSSEESPVCDGCSNACATGPVEVTKPDTVIPLIVLRRPPGA